MSVCAVVGGQFGSEGKGLIVGHIAKNYDHHVRVGAANAGHTLYVDGVKRVMQQVPCAAYANPDAQLWLGPGALVSPEILADEITKLWSNRSALGLDADVVLNIDARAHVVTPEHIAREQGTDLAERIGSTSATAREGIGAAQAARIMRESTCVTAEDLFTKHLEQFAWTTPGEWASEVRLRDVPMALASRSKILLEGTQGTGLSLTTGPFPYVTSRNTTAAGLAADCGIAPNRLDRIVLVCRTWPIRVAGNSGPFWWDSVETDWESLNVDPESERTTVTKKVRRVATFSIEQVREAVLLNGATEIALTFCDYMDPSLKGKEEIDVLTGPVMQLVSTIEEETNVPVTMLGTGPQTVIDLEGM